MVKVGCDIDDVWRPPLLSSTVTAATVDLPRETTHCDGLAADLGALAIDCRWSFSPKLVRMKDSMALIADNDDW